MRKFISLFCLFLFTFTLWPQLSIAQAPANTQKSIGAECSGAFGDSECKSGDCEKASDQKWYCDCDDDERSLDCATEYGVEDGEVWTCKAGTPESQDLDYCQSNLLGRDQYPINKGRASTWNDPRLSQDEIKKLTSKPELRIKIPGLTFSEPKVIEENGTAYISIPILGEYIKTVYRYGIAAAGIMAVIIIINAGFLWLRSAGNAQIITAQKESIEKAVIGLVIAVSSYSILFFINPRLTEFQNLKVEYVKTQAIENLVFEKNPEDEFSGSIPSALPTAELQKLFQAYAACFGFDPGILTGVALAESALNVQAGAGRKYQGLFQMDEAYCTLGLKTGNYPDSLKLNSCKEHRIHPEINTAAGAATIDHNLRTIKHSCPQIGVGEAMLLIYVGHNNGPGVMNYLLKNKACTQESMRVYVRRFYDSQPGGNRKGVDADWGERKFNYGKKVVNAVQKFNVTTLYPANGLNSSLCPKNTGKRVLPD